MGMEWNGTASVSSLVFIQVALHLRATKPFKDVLGVVRKTGEEWLVTMKEADNHIPDICEEVCDSSVRHQTHKLSYKSIKYN